MHFSYSALIFVFPDASKHLCIATLRLSSLFNPCMIQMVILSGNLKLVQLVMIWPLVYVAFHKYYVHEVRFAFNAVYGANSHRRLPQRSCPHRDL